MAHHPARRQAGHSLHRHALLDFLNWRLTSEVSECNFGHTAEGDAGARNDTTSTRLARCLHLGSGVFGCGDLSLGDLSGRLDRLLFFLLLLFVHRLVVYLGCHFVHPSLSWLCTYVLRRRSTGCTC